MIICKLIKNEFFHGNLKELWCGYLISLCNLWHYKTFCFVSCYRETEFQFILMHWKTVTTSRKYILIKYLRGETFTRRKFCNFCKYWRNMLKFDQRKIFLWKFANVYTMRNELQRPTWWKLKKICLMPKNYQILPLKVIIC